MAAIDSTGAPIENIASSTAPMQAAILSVRRRSGLPSRPSLRASRVALMPGTPLPGRLSPQRSYRPAPPQC